MGPGYNLRPRFHRVSGFFHFGILRNIMISFIPATIITCVLSCLVSANDDSGEILFQRYCGRCHGLTDKRSGSLVFHSKDTIISQYRNRPRQLLYKLENIDRYSISNVMVTAIHKIEDKRVLVSIVNYIANPESRNELQDSLKR